MDKPRFDGTDVHNWISRVQYYFDHIMLPDEHRLHYVVMLFDAPVAEWIFNYRDSNPMARWHSFLEDVRRRFDPNCFENYLGLISKLCQTGSLSEYNTTFEKMRSRISNIPESTFLPIYVAGLQQSVRNQVKHHHPTSVAKAMALAVDYDSCIEKPTSNQGFQRRNWVPREHRQPLGQSTTMPNTGPQSGRPIHAKGPEYSKLPVIRLTAAERADRTRRGVCWYCEEKWAPSHTCKRSFLAYMGAEDEDEEEQDSPQQDQLEMEVITADISHIYAMEGKQRQAGIELQGTIGASQPFRVYVGNGESLLCSYASLSTRLVIQNHVFMIDLHILPIHGPEVILGMAWLRTLRRVTSDYEKGTIEFVRNGAPVCLEVTPPCPKQVSLKTFACLLSLQGDSELFELMSVRHETASIGEPTTAVFPVDLPPLLTRVLETHSGIFCIPMGMPPPRQFDHRIHLAPNATPVNVRPYRYPYFQKNEIQRQVREMLSAGIIRPSQSPFSFPVLSIRKKDGTFRFCIDYRALNKATVPDHFPIPTTDELFDELGSARFFTKLDLRSGYHQIRMQAEDIYKTTFRTHDGHFEFLVMPFGLTNAPSTFQAAMNAIFRPLLRLSVIVFFDDILVYSPTLEAHAEHLHEVLSILEANQFFVKLSKCVFCSETVDYLGHLISDGQLKADPEKIATMIAWPVPSTIRQLRGFLGLTGYYRRFIAQYAMIAGPLTDLLKKDAFQWSPAAESSFTALKSTMTSAPVLRLPNFDKTFFVETDASDFGIGAVLLQDDHPLACFSKKLGPHRRVTSTYHKELYAIVEAVQKWHQYLLGREFVIRSDQKSLKELLQQVIQTPDQQLYARKLMGYKFRIEYKTGTSNRVADALSRRDMDPMPDRSAKEEADASLLTTVSHPIPEIVEQLKTETRELEDLVEIHASITEGTAASNLSYVDGLIYWDRRIYVGRASALKCILLYEHHSTPQAGHPGVDRTFRRLAASFYWKNMRKEVKEFVSACFDCQTTKYSTQKPAGLLQPLPIPNRVWEGVSMDFITSLPTSRGFTTIMVVVDRLSKYAHFAPLPPHFNALRVANLFIDTVVKHHGFPKTLVSDRDSVFLNEVWAELLRLSGTKLNFTTTYHPQSDGQTEVRNRGLEQYLRVFVADRPNKWVNFLPWAELALNCFHHEGLGTSPFTALYGREPPSLIVAEPSPTTPTEVADLIRQRGELIVTLRKNLERAQQRMKDSANRHRRELKFQIGDKVLLKLQQYRQHSVAKPLSTKLARRFFGPFEVIERIGHVAYRLQLPEGSRVHNVFHVSLLRPFVEAERYTPTEWPATFSRGRPVAVPQEVLDRRTVWRDGAASEEVLLRWNDNLDDQPTWEPVNVTKRHFPSLLEDKEPAIGGGVDTSSTEEHVEEEQQREQEDVPDYETADRGRETQSPSVKSTRPRRRTRPPVRFGDFFSK
ncbi:hypothetical protein AAHA92_18755 [Salvia divinorum]